MDTECPSPKAAAARAERLPATGLRGRFLAERRAALINTLVGGAEARSAARGSTYTARACGSFLKWSSSHIAGVWMNYGLKDVSLVAAEESSQAAATPAAWHEVALVAAVAAGAKQTSALGTEAQQLGRSGLRQAFCLCGFHEVLRERERNGEHLTEREQSLLALSRTGFLSIRSAVVDLAMQHLGAVVHGPGILPKPGEREPTVTEVFVVETVRNLAVHGSQALLDAGPDAALSLFGGNEHAIEPLAIFQLVFSASLALVETFERLAPGLSQVLARLSGALDAEVGRI